MSENEIYRPSTEAFARYFAGESPVEEIEQIQSWVSLEEENSEEFDRLRTIWQDVGTLKNLSVKVDVSAAFARVKAKKELYEHPSEKSLFAQVWKVAAVVVLAAAALVYYFQSQPEEMRFVAEAVEEVSMPDGSQITLNAGSSLTYNDDFGKDLRNVQLEGEAFFDVERDPEKPFVISMNDVTVTVLGTSFNVKSEENQINVSVVTGRVQIQSKFVTEVLMAGEQILIDLDEETWEESENSGSGIEQFWFTKKVLFEGSVLSEVIDDLQTVYNVKIEVDNPAILECKLNASFDNQPVEEVLEIIALAQGLQVENTGNTFLLKGEGCVN